MAAALADRRARAFILARVGRMEAGAFGDCKPVGAGVWEARIDYGPGYGSITREPGIA